MCRKKQSLLEVIASAPQAAPLRPLVQDRNLRRGLQEEQKEPTVEQPPEAVFVKIDPEWRDLLSDDSGSSGDGQDDGDMLLYRHVEKKARKPRAQTATTKKRQRNVVEAVPDQIFKKPIAQKVKIDVEEEYDDPLVRHEALEVVEEEVWQSDE